MAHGFLNKFGKGKLQVWSAGVETHGLNTEAVEAMKRIGIDISKHTSNHLDECADIEFDYVITVCDNAKERCPFFPGNAQVFHHNFRDPSKHKGSSAERLREFDNVRNEIRDYCQNFVSQILK